MTVLVTGGCGYIGSHTIVDLIENGYDVLSIDDFSNSSENVLDGIQEITGKRVANYCVDLKDKTALGKVFKDNNIDAVIHFAAFKAVGESVEDPIKYYENNIGSLINLLDVMEKSVVSKLVFSSSCTVYGISDDLPVVEDSAIKTAASPYGLTKQLNEMMIQDFSLHKSMSAILLRYFNPAGAHPSAKIGESPINPAQNLVPVITETAIGKRKEMSVFGADYDTRDGSCIRDYVHVCDLAHAHTLAVQHSLKMSNHEVDVFNLGIGKGVTVLEAISAFEKENGIKLNYKINPRRPGDIPEIYANPEKAHSVLKWSPLYNINDIMRSAWAWERVRNH